MRSIQFPRLVPIEPVERLVSAQQQAVLVVLRHHQMQVHGVRLVQQFARQSFVTAIEAKQRRDEHQHHHVHQQIE